MSNIYIHGFFVVQLKCTDSLQEFILKTCWEIQRPHYDDNRK